MESFFGWDWVEKAKTTDLQCSTFWLLPILTLRSVGVLLIEVLKLFITLF